MIFFIFQRLIEFIPYVFFFHIAVLIQGLLQSHTAVENFVLDKNIIERYRKRIETVRHSARKSDKNEVWQNSCSFCRQIAKKFNRILANILVVIPPWSENCFVHVLLIIRIKDGKVEHSKTFHEFV